MIYFQRYSIAEWIGFRPITRTAFTIKLLKYVLSYKVFKAISRFIPRIFAILPSVQIPLSSIKTLALRTTVFVIDCFRITERTDIHIVRSAWWVAYAVQRKFDTGSERSPIMWYQLRESNPPSQPYESRPFTRNSWHIGADSDANH